MTYKEAMKILQPPLIFGDEKQINAVKFIGDLELVFDAIRSCQHRGAHLRSYERFKRDPGELDCCDCFKKYYKKTSLPSSCTHDLQIAALEKLKAESDE